MPNARQPIRSFFFSAVTLSLLAWPASALGQEQPTGDALRVYFDCAAGFGGPGRGGGGVCDDDLYRQEITFVNWVREPQDAQVHVIMTSQDAGGGGNRYTFDFVGREELDGLEDQLTFSSGPTDVEAETLEGLVRTLSLGLVRYAVAAGYGDAVRVEGVEPEDAPRTLPAGAQDDPWNFWVFDIEGDVSINAEDLRESREYGFSASANRTTQQWKLNARASGDWERERFEIPDEETVYNDQDEWELSAFAVRSLSAHMGVGTELLANNSTQLNRELLTGVATGVEYNYFPYSESNRRVLLARYIVSVQAVEYQDTTIFDLLQETVYRHELNLDFDTRETWGNANIGVGVSQYLDRTDAWSFRVDGFLRYRLFRGFSINIRGEYQKIEDQIYLSKEELDDECYFIECRRLPTESQTEFNIGLSYSFGSIYNNVVNERFSFGLF